VRAEHLQQTEKHLLKMFWGVFSVSGPGSLFLLIVW
jgi:hypothetical protein